MYSDKNVQVLEKIKPTTKEKLLFKNVTAAFLQSLNSKLKKATAILGGSGAKNTWLSGNHDIDIFVLFNYKTFFRRSAELADLLEPILKKAFPKEKILRVHGSRDYFQLHYLNFFFEVIPILQITSATQAVNITDVSPLHSKWVNQHAKKLKDEIRLSKQFCRSQRVYGAESYIGGFSGYVLEILVVVYGSFKKVLAASEKWEKLEVIDVEKHYRGQEALFELNSSKHSPLIVIDPVDKSRNAAAALTLEKFLLFKKKAKEYLKKPTSTFFEKITFNIDSLQQKFPKHSLVYLEVQEKLGKKDVVGSKLWKAFKFLQERLQKFSLVEADWDWNRYYFVVKQKTLPDFAEQSGPPLKLTEAVANFKKKHNSTYIRSGTIYSQIKVKNPKLEDYLKELFQNQYLKEKVQKVRICRVL